MYVQYPRTLCSMQTSFNVLPGASYYLSYYTWNEAVYPKIAVMMDSTIVWSTPPKALNTWVFVTTRPKIAYSSTMMVVVQGSPNPGDTTLRKAPVFLLSINPVFSSSPAVTGTDQYGYSAVYVGDPGSNRVNKIDGFTGDGIGYVHTAGQVLTSPIVDSGGTVYFGDDQNMYGAVSTANSSLFAIKWSYNFTGGVVSSPALTNFYGGLVVSTMGGGRLVLFNDTVVDKQYTSRSSRPSGQPTMQPSQRPNTRSPTINTNFVISTIAGTGVYGTSADGGPATLASLKAPNKVSMDNRGNLFIAETDANRVRMVSTAGIITTFAGALSSGFSGDNGPASSAMLYSPQSVAVDISGNVYIADQWNLRIRKVNSAGIITTFAGTGVAGATGNGGAATLATLAYPRDIFPDISGNVYIADSNNFMIRVVNSAGIISTLAGTGTMGGGGDGGAAGIAQVNNPYGVCADIFGNVFIAEQSGAKIRKIDSAGIITTFAGSGAAGYNGDGIAATTAQLYAPQGVFADLYGSVYIADRANYRLRKVSSAGIITTIAGTGTAGSLGDGGGATSSQLNAFTGVYVDISGNVYIADTSNNKIRYMGAPKPTTRPSSQPSRQPSTQPSQSPTGIALVKVIDYKHVFLFVFVVIFMPISPSNPLFVCLFSLSTPMLLL